MTEPRQPTTRQRHRGRMVAFQALFEADSTGHQPAAVLERFRQETSLHPDALAYAGELVAGVAQRRREIDTIIARHASARPIDQLSPVDRNLLRLGVFEAIFNSSTIPVGVAIDEAVELAKLYGSESSSRFVNGVLGRVAREAQGNTSTQTDEE